MQSDFFLKGKLVSVIPTTNHHLAVYTSWHKWEGDLEILIEEEEFANQKDRTRRLKLISGNSDSNAFYLSVITPEEELISLLEMDIINTDLYCSSWIMKKIKAGKEHAMEAGKLIINYFFSYYNLIDCIIFDLPEKRTESIKILEQFGFKQMTYYYRKDFKNKWEKIITLHLRK